MSDDIPKKLHKPLKLFYTGKHDVFSRAPRYRYRWSRVFPGTQWHHVDDIKPDGTNPKKPFKNHHPTNIIPIGGGLNGGIDAVRKSKYQRDIPSPIGPRPSLDTCFREGDEVSGAAKYHREQGFRPVSYGCYRTAAFFYFNNARELGNCAAGDDVRNVALFYATRALEHLIQEKDVSFATDTLFRNILPLVQEARDGLAGPISKWQLRPEVLATLATDISDYYKLSQDALRAAKWTWFARFLTQKKGGDRVLLEPLITRLDYHTAEQMINMLQHDSRTGHRILARSRREVLLRWADFLLARSIEALSQQKNPLGRLAMSADVIALLLEQDPPAVTKAKKIADLGSRLSQGTLLETRQGANFSQAETSSSSLTDGLMRGEIELVTNGSLSENGLTDAVTSYKALSENRISSVGVDTNLRVVRLLERHHATEVGTSNIIRWRCRKDLSTPVSIGTLDRRERSFNNVAAMLWKSLSATHPAMKIRGTAPFEYLRCLLEEPDPVGSGDMACGLILKVIKKC